MLPFKTCLTLNALSSYYTFQYGVRAHWNFTDPHPAASFWLSQNKSHIVQYSSDTPVKHQEKNVHMDRLTGSVRNVVWVIGEDKDARTPFTANVVAEWVSTGTRSRSHEVPFTFSSIMGVEEAEDLGAVWKLRRFSGSARGAANSQFSTSCGKASSARRARAECLRVGLPETALRHTWPAFLRSTEEITAISIKYLT